jgi:hypothetical protein
MPGPTRWRGQLANHSLMSKKISQHSLNLRVLEVLKLVNHARKTGIPENAPEKSRDIPATAELLRNISAESIVLLKNEQMLLPLKKNKSVSVVQSFLLRTHSDILGCGNRTKCEDGSILWWWVCFFTAVLCRNAFHWYLLQSRECKVFRWVLFPPNASSLGDKSPHLDR